MWFKKKKQRSQGPQTLPLSLERVRARFDQEGWDYDYNEESQVITTGFGYTPLQILVNNEDLSVVCMARSEKVTAERFLEVLAWLEQLHDEHPVPTITADVAEDTGQVTVIADLTIPGAMDYSDAQLFAWIDVAINSMQEAHTSFFATFDPEPLERARAEHDRDC